MPYHLCLHDVDEVLLLTQSFSCHIDIILQELELLLADVAVLAFALQLLFLLLLSLLLLLHLCFEFLLLVLLLLIVKSIFLRCTLAFEHLINHVLKRANCRLFLLNGPVLHDCIFELDAELILPQRLIILFDAVSLVVMEDVVEGNRLERCVDRLLNLAELSRHVLTLFLYLFELRMGQEEGRDGSQAHEVCISVIFDHERKMVDDCSPAKSLDDESLILASAIIFDSYFNDAVLNQIKPVRCFILLAKISSFFVCLSFHAINDLLLRKETQLSKVRDLAHFHEEPGCQRILVLENLLLEQ